ncbi:MAG: hypothetical protein HZB16_15625 [Armatimonadetes bacterium]|nr:hypothetical protein [Armatimonadota bacterium]
MRTWLCSLLCLLPAVASAADSVLDPRLTFTLDEVPFTRLATEIQEQTGYGVVVPDALDFGRMVGRGDSPWTRRPGPAQGSDADLVPRLSLSVKDVGLRAVLNLLAGQGYDVEPRGDSIAISGGAASGAATLGDLAPAAEADYPYRVTLSSAATTTERELESGAQSLTRRVTRLRYRVRAETELLSRALLGARVESVFRVGDVMATGYGPPTRPFEPLGADGTLEYVVPWSGAALTRIGYQTLLVAWCRDAEERVFTFDPYGMPEQRAEQPGASVVLHRLVDDRRLEAVEAMLTVVRPMSGPLQHLLSRVAVSGSAGPRLSALQMPIDSDQPSLPQTVISPGVTGIGGVDSVWDSVSMWPMPFAGRANDGSRRRVVPVGAWVDTATDPLAPVVLLEGEHGRRTMAVGLREISLDPATARLTLRYVARAVGIREQPTKLRVGLVDFGRAVDYQTVRFGDVFLGEPAPLGPNETVLGASGKEAPDGG